jgi:hypothetical protein
MCLGKRAMKRFAWKTCLTKRKDFATNTPHIFRYHCNIGSNETAAGKTIQN